MEALSLITVALADGLWQVGKKLLEATSDSASKPAKEKLEERPPRNDTFAIQRKGGS